MQPLISPIDHESRHSSYRSEDGAVEASEQTPLLQRFPHSEPEDRGTASAAIFSLLLLILVAGVVIGVYLLVVQSHSENILPPVETPLQLVSRSQWDPNANLSEVKSSPLRARQVVIVQTDTQPCYSPPACIQLLQEIQKNSTLPYNFLVSSNGQTFEGLGWHRQSHLFSEHAEPSLVLAFLGNFTRTAPTRAQLDETQNFLAESVRLQHLHPSFVVFGKRTKESPTCLFESLTKLSQWNSQLTDT